MAAVALEVRKPVWVRPKGVHLAGRRFRSGRGWVDEEIIGLADAAWRPACRSCGPARQGAKTGWGTDGHVVIGGKVERDRLDGHGPAVHPGSGHTTERARGPLGGADLIDGRAGPAPASLF